MVAIKNHEAERFIQNLPSDVFIYLLHGPDKGLVDERSNSIIRSAIDDKTDPFQFVQLAGDEVADGPSKLLDEVNTLGLFNERRAIHVIPGRKPFLDELRILLQSPPDNITVVISSGPLRRDSALRTLCARSKHAAVIDCYPDQERDIVRLLETELQTRGQKVSAEAKQLLANALGADRLITRSELEKLYLYTSNEPEISADHVMDVIVNAKGNELDDVLNSSFLGQSEIAAKLFDKLEQSGADTRLLLTMCMRRCSLLHRYLSNTQTKPEAVQIAEKEAGRTFPIMQKTKILSQIKIWDRYKLLTILRKLRHLEHVSRVSAHSSSMTSARAIWMISHSVQRQH